MKAGEQSRLGLAVTASAQPAACAREDRLTIETPETLNLHVEIEANSGLQSVYLHMEAKQQADKAEYSFRFLRKQDRSGEVVDLIIR